MQSLENDESSDDQDHPPTPNTHKTRSQHSGISRIDKSKITRPKKFIQRRNVKVKPKAPPIQKYFTDGRNVTDQNITDLDKTKPYKFPTSYEELGQKIMTKAWRRDIVKQDLKAPIFKKQGMREKLNNDLFNRLYVKVPTAENTKTIVDLDPQFFKVVEGRPIHESFNRREYIDTVRESLRTKILIGYREDDIALINQSLANEEKLIQQIQENYQIYVNAFEDLLFRDHMSAKQLLAEAEAITNEAYEKYEEFKRLSKKYGSMRAALYGSEEKWRNCKMYQSFLYNISPLQWRNEHPEQKSKYSDIEEHFEESTTALAEKTGSLSEMIEFMKDECANEPSPEIYFTVWVMDVMDDNAEESNNLNVPAEQVALLEGTCYNEQMKIMKLAEKAAKQYTELNTLTKQLSKAYAPPYQRGPGKRKNRSQVVDPPVKITPPPRDLTEEEEEYLEYFTDFCKYTDDPQKYGIDRSRTGKHGIHPQVTENEKVSARPKSRAKYVTRMNGIEFLEKVIMTNT
uniref:Uncharacterized protein LOC114340986 n=1 Tax=Diabrotica virgifera virgifera TaxID=50390 RepID=A0A6P7GUP7_DIAVI